VVYSVLVTKIVRLADKDDSTPVDVIDWFS
jgi:hypothetical protein